jgi:hypothetical protein
VKNTSESPAVGVIDGVAEGYGVVVVGFSDAEGIGDGANDGRWVGGRVGDSEGIGVGAGVGRSLGVAEGARDGKTVGLGVGG